MAVINGINKDTIKNMQLDAGVILNDEINPESATISDEITNKSIGATKGATTFSAIPEIRNIFDGIDGVRGDIKDGNVIDKWEVTLKTSVTEFTLNNLKLALGAGTESKQGEKFDTLEPNDVIVTNDYKTITWIGSMAGSSEPIIIILRDCLNMNGLTITAEDKSTGTVEIELRAHVTLGGSKKQFTIYLPKNQLPSRTAHVEELKLDK